MNRELELLVEAYDAMIEARGDDAKRAAETYDTLLEDSLELHPNLSRETLGRMIAIAHRGWINAQKQPPSIPPKA